jgi:glucan 1,3-beta-glucosidase
MNWDQHIQSACSHGDSLASFSQSELWEVVGEWSPASTDCAPSLNGRGVGARYDGSYSGSSHIGSCTGKTGPASSFSSDYKTFLRKYWEAQTQTYERGIGWIMWAWKAENADDWSYQAGLKVGKSVRVDVCMTMLTHAQNGWIPQNPTNYQYPNICGS